MSRHDRHERDHQVQLNTEIELVVDCMDAKSITAIVREIVEAVAQETMEKFGPAAFSCPAATSSKTDDAKIKALGA